jgi:hypothetical protein
MAKPLMAEPLEANEPLGTLLPTRLPATRPLPTLSSMLTPYCCLRLSSPKPDCGCFRALSLILLPMHFHFISRSVLMLHASFWDHSKALSEAQVPALKMYAFAKMCVFAPNCPHRGVSHHHGANSQCINSRRARSSPDGSGPGAHAMLVVGEAA